MKHGNGNGHSADDELARRALRDVLGDPKAGTRVKTSAARNLLRVNGSIGQRDVEEGLPKDPMRDMQLCEDARQALKLGGRRKAWRQWWAAWERGDDLDVLEALLRELRAS